MTTNRDLSVAIAEGSFRSDLFYRLNVFPIHVPPLRKRREDIPNLVEYFVSDSRNRWPSGFARSTGEPWRSVNNTRGLAIFVNFETSWSDRSSFARGTPSRSTRHGYRLRYPLARTDPRSLGRCRIRKGK